MGHVIRKRQGLVECGQSHSCVSGLQFWGVLMMPLEGTWTSGSELGGGMAGMNCEEQAGRGARQSLLGGGVVLVILAVVRPAASSHVWIAAQAAAGMLSW